MYIKYNTTAFSRLLQGLGDLIAACALGLFRLGNGHLEVLRNLLREPISTLDDTSDWLSLLV